ncbi:MAG: filamentous hemagglutinin N-terminal domain-containing protein, partial [Desulfuromonadales bacterium]
GALQSNGKVLLINQNGILFGPNSRIEVNGLIASTLDITNQDFLAGRMKFSAGPVAGKVENQGTITTPGGGFVYLIAQDVTNSGVITAPNGDIMLAAGKEILLVDSRSPEIAIVVSAPEHQAINLGTLVADAGRVGTYGGIVRQKGIISANSAVMEGGKIFLRATKSIELADSSVISADGTKGGQVIVKTDEEGKISGTLTARGSISAQGDGAKGSGGFVETSAAKVDVNSVKINTNGGNWLLDPYDFTVAGTGGDITGAVLSLALGSNDVTIQTLTGSVSCTNATCAAGNSSGNGDILVNEVISWSADKTLVLNAYRNININTNISASGSLAGLTLIPGTGGSGSATLVASKTISLNGGVIDVTGGTGLLSLGSSSTVSNAILRAGSLSMASSTNITLNGTTLDSDFTIPNGSQISVNSGDLTLGSGKTLTIGNASGIGALYFGGGVSQSLLSGGTSTVTFGNTSVTSSTIQKLDSGASTLTLGSGITLNGSGSGRIYGAGYSGGFTNQAILAPAGDLVIDSWGSVSNTGTITAGASTKTITVTTASFNNTNATLGSITASGGGTLDFRSATTAWSSTAGSIVAASGGTIKLSTGTFGGDFVNTLNASAGTLNLYGTISGGTINSTSGTLGVLNLQNNSTITGSTISGSSLAMPTGAYINFNGLTLNTDFTIPNGSQVSVNSGDLTLGSGKTLTIG